MILKYIAYIWNTSIIVVYMLSNIYMYDCVWKGCKTLVFLLFKLFSYETKKKTRKKWTREIYLYIDHQQQKKILIKWRYHFFHSIIHSSSFFLVVVFERTNNKEISCLSWPHSPLTSNHTSSFFSLSWPIAFILSCLLISF